MNNTSSIIDWDLLTIDPEEEYPVALAETVIEDHPVYLWAKWDKWSDEPSAFVTVEYPCEVIRTDEPSHRGAVAEFLPASQWPFAAGCSSGELYRAGGQDAVLETAMRGFEDHHYARGRVVHADMDHLIEDEALPLLRNNSVPEEDIDLDILAQDLTTSVRRVTFPGSKRRPGLVLLASEAELVSWYQ